MAGGYVHNPKGPEGVALRIRKLERDLDRVRRAISHLGITIDPDTNALVVPAGRKIRIDGGDLDVEAGNVNLDGGDLIASGGNIESGNFVAGSAGYRLRANGNAEFSDLTLRDSIIGNDALTAPVFPARAHGQASNFALTTTQTSKAAVSVSVPAGYSRALCLATMTASAVNTRAVQDYFAGYADVNTAGSPGGFLAAADGAPGFAVGLAHTEIALATSLGSTIQFRAMLQSGAASWSADPFNAVNIDALVLFLR